jgi:hypothetical protein
MEVSNTLETKQRRARVSFVSLVLLTGGFGTFLIRRDAKPHHTKNISLNNFTRIYYYVKRVSDLKSAQNSASMYINALTVLYSRSCVVVDY